jgi:hypothetical protein
MVQLRGDDYDSIRALRAELDELGEEEWSIALYDAMTYSSSASEVRGEIRRVLRELRDSGVSRRLANPETVDREIRTLSRLRHRDVDWTGQPVVFSRRPRAPSPRRERRRPAAARRAIRRRGRRRSAVLGARRADHAAVRQPLLRAARGGSIPLHRLGGATARCALRHGRRARRRGRPDRRLGGGLRAGWSHGRRDATARVSDTQRTGASPPGGGRGTRPRTVMRVDSQSRHLTPYIP